MAQKDLTPTALNKLTWETNKLAEPLAEVIQFAQQKAGDAVGWYYQRRGKRRLLGRGSRVLAILLTACAGIWPLFKEVYQACPAAEQANALHLAVSNAVAGGTNTLALLSAVKPVVTPCWLNPVWSAIALALAATLLALDRFYGWTSGWVRYALSAQQLSDATDDFTLEMEALKAGWGQAQPTVAQTQTALLKIQEFVKQVDAIVREETKAWAAEFASVLKELDEKVRLAVEAQQKGALQITVTNGDQSPKGWKLTVGSQPTEDRSGKEASVKVSPDLYVVRVTGELNGKAAQAEKAVKVAAGEIQKVELTLA